MLKPEIPDGMPGHDDYGDPCVHRAAWEAVTTHTRTSAPENGPDFCAECSDAIREWVPWPCDRAATGRDALPAIAPIPAHLTAYDADPALLRDELLSIITHAIEYHPRSQQVKLGPSEVGHPCARRLGYKFLQIDENPAEPNWKATVGTGVHAWLEDVFTQANSGDPAARWLTEMRVDAGTLAGQTLDGHCDLFDRVTGTSVDWKTHGPSILKRYRAKVNRGECPDPTYRAQAHIYGLGWTRRGQHVERVALMGLPRDGRLTDAYFWSEPYDEQIALAAIARAEGISVATQALGVAALDLLPTADAFCSMCPFYRAGSTDLSNGCPGDPASQRTQAPALTLG